MAFSELQKLSIGEALNVQSHVLDSQILTYTASITPAVETRILDLLDAINAVSFISIEPTESNEGLRINPGATEKKLLRKLANLLFFYDLPVLSYGGQSMMMRG